MPDDTGRVNLAKVSPELRQAFQDTRGDRQWEPFLRDVLDAYVDEKSPEDNTDDVREAVREENQRLKRELLEELRR